MIMTVAEMIYYSRRVAARPPKGCFMPTKLTRAAATSFAAVALAATAGFAPAPASATAAPTASVTSVAASTWIKYGDYSSEAKCIAKGKALRSSGAYLSYYCTYTGFFTLMVLTR
jgi:hypothetical protein